MRFSSAEATLENPSYRQTLIAFLYQLADDELVMGHRLSEWLGLAPDLEEDIAFGSIAQDEIGHATFYFSLLEQLGEGDKDGLAFQRLTEERRSASLLERPNGDWAYSIVRGYVYDTFEQVRLRVLCQSGYLPLSQGAVKMFREEHYHHLHMKTWFERLAAAGGEAHQRLVKAIHEVWQDLHDLFSLGDLPAQLLEYGIFPLSEEALSAETLALIEPSFVQFKLPWPNRPSLDLRRDGRRGLHAEDLRHLLQVLGEVVQMNPAARW